jgi:hypothetical protein
MRVPANIYVRDNLSHSDHRLIIRARHIEFLQRRPLYVRGLLGHRRQVLLSSGDTSHRERGYGGAAQNPKEHGFLQYKHTPNTIEFSLSLSCNV